MAWFGEGLSSLRGQLSNLAKGVLVEEEESEKKIEGSAVDSSGTDTLHSSLAEGPGWADAEVDTFIGQDAPQQINVASKSSERGSPLNNRNMDKDVATMIPKGIANFFQQITTIPDSYNLKIDKEIQTDAGLMSTDNGVIQRLTEQNAQLNIEVDSLRRMVRDLESQVALSQDENANLSTGLEALDIQHQEAIERILNVRDESQRQLEQVREELRLKNEEFSKLTNQNNTLKKELEDLNQELIANEGLAQENARLRERISELNKTELTPIEEHSAAEDHIRMLESEVIALRESRDNLERETNTLLTQIRQRDAQLRQLDARVEEAVKEKEIKEREMTQIVFDCNSLRQELKSATEKIDDLEKDVLPLREENRTLKEELESVKNELYSAKKSIEAAKQEANLSRDESETLKSELESLKEELGGEEAKAVQDSRELQQARLMAKTASSEIQNLQDELLDARDEFNKLKIKYENDKSNFTDERQALQKELDLLHDTAREYGIQKDIFREKELELKRQLVNVETELSNIKCLLEEEKTEKGKEIEGLKELIKHSKIENENLRSKLENYIEKDNKLESCLGELENLQKERLKFMTDLEEMTERNKVLLADNSQKEKELLEYKSKLELLDNDIIKYTQSIDKFQNSLFFSEEELKKTKDQMEALASSHVKHPQADKMTEVEEENEKHLARENQELSSKLDTFSKQNEFLSNGLQKLTADIDLLREEKFNIEEKFKIFVQQKDVVSEETFKNAEREKETFLNEIKSLKMENELAIKKLKELEEIVSIANQNNTSLSEKFLFAQKEIEAFYEQLKPFGGSLDGVHKLSNQTAQLSFQIEHLKDELKEVYEEKTKLSKEVSVLSLERNTILEQNQFLRGELDNLSRLKEELENLKDNFEIKSSEVKSLDQEVKRLQSALNTQLSNNEILYKEKADLKQRCDGMYIEMMNKMSYIEEVEKAKNKEIDNLKQEIDNLKTQLEFASQLLQDVERQEGEGQPSGESNSQKTSPELQEEISRLSAALLKEQTDCKLLKKQLEETKEKLEKAENQLKTLKIHLVTVEDSYSSELSSAEEKLRETQTLLHAAEERARSSSTAYTSASIRANQQVEALREQVRLLTEHKEKLEAEVSKAEDAAMKQSATVTRLQAVLHQFQRDKQKDIEFETERIRRELAISRQNSEELSAEIKNLQEQLNEAKKGLAAGQKLSEELLRKEELVALLKVQVHELTEKLKAKEEKVNDLSSDSKVDRQLVKNLLVGYVSSPIDLKLQVLGVLGQVLALNKEERQKVGLEPGGRQQSLSEAFIRFLQAESQPRPEVILPLSVPSEPGPSRKSSLLTQEVPVLPHFPVGRNPGSILKDVLQERRPE